MSEKTISFSSVSNYSLENIVDQLEDSGEKPGTLTKVWLGDLLQHNQSLMQKLQKSRYYSSNLSRYIGENLPHNFTFINVDMSQTMFLEEKKKYQVLRIIEEKQFTEHTGHQQLHALAELGNAFYLLNSVRSYPRCECYIVRTLAQSEQHEPTRLEVTVLSVSPEITNQTLVLTCKKEIDDFLSVKTYIDTDDKKELVIKQYDSTSTK